MNKLNLIDNKLYRTRTSTINNNNNNNSSAATAAASAPAHNYSTVNQELLNGGGFGGKMTNGGVAPTTSNGGGGSYKSKRVDVKRLSNTSTSTVSSAAAEAKEKRGRKPLGAAPNIKSQHKAEKLKMQAKQALKVEDDEKLARFGNKFVLKDTNEYDDRRKKNNEAVQKCRQKNAEEQKKREEKMQHLSDENNRLTNRVDELTKELSVLKSILLKTSPLQSLPDSLQKLLQSTEFSSNQK
jgi:hypothetical protein